MGDMNITMDAGVVWGHKGNLDMLTDYFKDLLNIILLRDISPCPICLTWSNE